MSQSQSITSANQLLREPASDVQRWLKAVQAKQRSVPHEFNWLGLAQATATNAYSDRYHTAEQLVWAEIAIAVYAKLSEVGFPENEPFLQSAMMLRAAMIRKFGAVVQHPVLDMDAMTQWFFSHLSYTYEEAKEKAAYWQEPAHWQDKSNVSTHIDEIRQLRRIKVRLSVLASLPESEQFQFSEALKQWLFLRDKLP
ncbi:MAG: hypothetical protein KME27_18560 [Lyngbya sp. HA4199-MV5]|jgi:hypothetical protein|nr:hypothetical protein [Lyngbya sp. HA4199-MV5]